MTVIIVICFALSLAALVISLRAFQEKGFLLNNAYIYASPEEREKLDKKPWYRQTAIAFLLISIIFALLALEVWLDAHWLFFGVLALSVAAVVYAIASSIAIEKKTK
ncbi:MAG: DUF3784 domain-containing protein [Clostridia bacterium]|nr:DUF3784 domain-containing protein [Clostridia bacterium]